MLVSMLGVVCSHWYPLPFSELLYFDLFLRKGNDIIIYFEVQKHNAHNT